MPTVDWSLPATWATAYSISAQPPRSSTLAEVRLGYHRSIMYPAAEQVAANLIRILSLTATDQVVVVGAGYGWTVEALGLAVPGMEVNGLDPSPYIQDRKGSSGDAELDAAIVAVGHDPATGYGAAVKAAHGDPLPRTRGHVTVADEDMGNGGSRGRILRLFGGRRVTGALSELVLDTLLDAEVTDLIGRVSAVDPGNMRVIAHMLVTTEQKAKAGFHNVHTRAEWRTLVDEAGGTDHLLIEAGSYMTSRGAGDPWVRR